MANLEGQAKRLHERLKSLSDEMESTKSRLVEKQKEKEAALLEGRPVDALNENIRRFTEQIKDQTWLRTKLIEELLLTGERIKGQRLQQTEKKLARIKVEMGKHEAAIKSLSAEIQKHKAYISLQRVHLNGELIEVNEQENLGLQSLLCEHEREELRHKSAPDFLAELSIEVVEEKRPEIRQRPLDPELRQQIEEAEEVEEQQRQGREEAEETEERHQRRMKAEELESEEVESVFG